MNGEWGLAKKCPHCGGPLTFSSYYMYSRDRTILKNGRPSSRSRKDEERPVGGETIHCEWCHVFWDCDDTQIMEDGTAKIRGDGKEW